MGLVGSLRARVGLTGRAWAFVASGAVVVGAGLLTGLVPVVQFGTLLAAVPVAAALLTRGPGRLVLQRTLSAREIATGDLLRVTVHVRGRFAVGRSLLLEDLAPPALGGSHRFALNASGQALTRPHYAVRAGARGLHHIGPMAIHIVDRFGMVHRVVPGGGRDEVLIHPRVAALDPLVLSGASVGSGGGQLGALGAASDDVIPRPYRPGDEMRRIDWKAVARTGDLMVRSEESPWRSAVTVVVDMNEDSHRGGEPDSSVDAALSMAASIGCMALAAGWDVTVRTTDDTIVFEGSPMAGVETGRRVLLRALATLPRSHVPVPATSLRHSTDSPGPLVLVAGALSLPAARVLAGIGRQSPQRMLVQVDVATWRGPGQRAAAGGSMPAFAEAGWKMTRLRRGGGVAEAWSALGERA